MTLLVVFSVSLATAQNDPASEKNAVLLAQRSIERLTLGDAFDAKLRQRIWASGREVVGVGHYEQSGKGTGSYSLEMTVHDGVDRQSMKQISDGKLTWHRIQIGTGIEIRRVDLGRIDEYEREMLALRGSTSRELVGEVPARLRVGGLVELVDRIRSDYVLELKKGTVERQPVWILHGKLRPSVRAKIQADSGRDKWASLCPVEVRVAIAATADATGFGAGLPLRIEFYSEPTIAPEPLVITPVSANTDETNQTMTVNAPGGRVISLLEVYAARRIEASPEERFRFVSDDREVTFTNDTRRYLDLILPP